MNLEAMAAMAADLSASVADLGARVGALEGGGAAADAVAVPNTFFITTFGTSSSPQMIFAEAWNPLGGYQPGETVTFNSATYVNIAPTAASALALGPLPAGIADLKPTLTAYNPAERVATAILPTNPPYTLRGKKLSPAIAFQIQRVAKAPLTFFNPNFTYAPGGGIGREEPAFVHTAIWDATGEKAFQAWGGAGEAEWKPGLPEADTTFWVVLFATAESGGEGEYNPSTVTRLAAMRVAGGTTIVGTNTPPSEDREHWAQIAAVALTEPEIVALIEAHAPGGAFAPKAPEKKGELAAGKEEEPSATSDCLVTLAFRSEANAEATIRVTVAGVESEQIKVLETAHTYDEIYSFVVPKGKKFKYAVGVGGITKATWTMQKLN